jgi:hypothetical protein
VKTLNDALSKVTDLFMNMIQIYDLRIMLLSGISIYNVYLNLSMDDVRGTRK